MLNLDFSQEKSFFVLIWLKMKFISHL